MKKEDIYVTLEQAEELNKLGYDKTTKARWNLYWTCGWKLDVLEYSEIELVRKYLSAPTKQEYNEFMEAYKNGN